MKNLSIEQLQKVESLFERALDLDTEARTHFLETACDGDVALQMAIRSLLRSHDEAADFLETPIINRSTGLLTGGDQSISSLTNILSDGSRIAHYEVIRELGRGGMGEVYLARDGKLDRLIALKLLPHQMTVYDEDDEQVQRFEREARAASALNHPNIITIHEIGRQEGLHFIAMEFIEGQTLREAIASQPLSVPAAVDIAIQIARALQAAHAAGIVHRDIKPENIMIRHDGLVKVLDFGLAKPVELPVKESPVRQSLSSPLLTNPQTLMGTAGYMSPEQIQLMETDHRTDIFSLGIVLYEMLAGKRPFAGSTTADLLDAISSNPPALFDSPKIDLPVDLQQLFNRALEKERTRRYQTAGELLRDLQQIACQVRVDTDEVAKKPTSPFRHWQGKAALAAGSFLILMMTAYWFTRPPLATSYLKPSVIAAARPIAQDKALERFPSLSPDGQTIIYESSAAGVVDIYLQRLGDGNTVNLTRNYPYNASQPTFSPDGQRIAFWSGGIFTMKADGSDIRRISHEGYNPDWSPDGKEITFAMDRIIDSDRFILPSQLWAVDVTTLEKRLITEGDAAQPKWSPQGHRIAYWGLQRGGQRDIFTIAASGGNPVVVTDDAFEDWNPVWSPDGRYLYFISNRSGGMNLWRVAIDEESGRVMSAPEPVTTPAVYCWHVCFSRDGRRVAYAQINKKANIRQIAFDPKRARVIGESASITEGSSFATQPHRSGGGPELVYNSIGEKQEDLFTLSLTKRSDRARSIRGMEDYTAQRLTDDVFKDRNPQWSPDGQQIAFYSDRSGKYQIWLINRDGSGLRQLTDEQSDYVYNPVWSPDRSRLAYALTEADGIQTVVIEPGKSWTEQTPTHLPRDDKKAHYFLPASWSRDGLKLAGWQHWTKRDKAGIFIYSFASQSYEQLTDFGDSPLWLSDNRRLLFTRDDKLYVIDSRTRQFEMIHRLTANDWNGYFGFTLSADERWLYFSHATIEADIWVADMQ